MPEVEDKESPNSVVLVVHCPWCSKQEPSVTIGISNYKWRIHKCLLVRGSSYFERVLQDQDEHNLPHDFPGGAAALDAIVSFCFDSRVPVMRSWNVVALRCAAEFLGMNRDRSGDLNLARKSDSYLSRVVLRSWPHTLLVLSDCYNSFLPLAAELGIVSRCLETLAGFISASFGSGSSSSDSQGSDSSWWVDDIVRIPAGLFARMITLLRSRNVCERLLGEVVIKWCEIWIFNNGNDQVNNNRSLIAARSWNSSLSSFSCDSIEQDENYLDGELAKMVSKEVSPGRNSIDSFSSENHLQLAAPGLSHSTRVESKLELLEGIAQVLPYDRSVMPISFLFLLLRYAFAMDASPECKSQVETRISLQLENASLDDFLMPFKSPSREDCKRNSELDSMKKIVSRFLTQHQRNVLSSSETQNKMMLAPVDSPTPCFEFSSQVHNKSVCSVAGVWDQYLTEIACDCSIPVDKFTELVEIVPAHARASHDQLYKAIHIFLKAHGEISPQERADVCRALNCLRLSQESCIQAVQNELMPLRTIVQAMFMQQLQTRNAIDSHFLRGNQILRLNQNSPVFQANCNSNKKDHQNQKPPPARDQNEKNDPVPEGLIKETNARLQGLEAAMAQMRKSLRENASNNENESSCVSCSSASSGSSSQQTPNNDSTKRKRRFFRKSNSGRRRGVARIAKLFQKMGFLGLCKTAASRSSIDFAPDPSPAPNGCLNIDQKNFRRGHKKSWDQAEFTAKQSRHSRHHSVA